MKLSLAIQTPDVQRVVPVALLSGTLEEKLAHAAQWGADGVEFMPADPASLDGAAIRAALQQHRLEAAAVGSGAVAFATSLTLLHSEPIKAAQAEARLRDLIAFAAAVGAPLVTIGSFRGRLAAVGEDGRERLRVVLREAAAYAQERGIRLALEPLNHYEMDFLNRAEEVLSFIQEMGHPALGVLLDTYHFNMEESSWTEPFRRAMVAGKLWHVHLGDNNRLPPGRGLINFHAIIAILREAGYRGYLSAELWARPDPDTAARQTLAYMRALLEG